MLTHELAICAVSPVRSVSHFYQLIYYDKVLTSAQQETPHQWFTAIQSSKQKKQKELEERHVTGIKVFKRVTAKCRACALYAKGPKANPRHFPLQWQVLRKDLAEELGDVRPSRVDTIDQD